MIRRVCSAVAAAAIAATVLVVASAPSGAQVDEPAIDEPVTDAAATTTTTVVAPQSKDAAEPPASTTPTAPVTEPVTAAAAAIDGWVADAGSGQPLGGICVVFYSVDNKDGWNGAVITSGDGSWSFTPAVSGAQRIAAFRPAVDGDCASMPRASGPVPEWVFDVPLTPADPLTAVPPPESATILDGTNRVDICLGDTQLHQGGCELRPQGPGTITGTVVQPGPLPVDGACVYALTEIAGSTTVYGALTDAEGSYTVEGLPVDVPFYVGVVPSTAQQSCQSENGPPPMPGPDELQPEFYADVWVDLTSPALDDHPTQYASSLGAVAVQASATDVDVCLTTESGSTEPRSTCAQATSAPVTEPTATAVSTDPPVDAAVAGAAAEPATAVSATLPLTGRDPTVPATVGLALVALGVAGVLASRRRPLRRHG